MAQHSTALKNDVVSGIIYFGAQYFDFPIESQPSFLKDLRNE